jgi:hypothetical protein
LLRHIAAAEEVPALGIVIVCADGFLQVLDSLFLACVTVALLVVQPSELLQDLGMVRVLVKHSAIGGLGSVKIFLLLVHMTNLEIDVLLGEWARGIVDDVLEAFQTLAELLLLFVNDSEAEINFVGLFKVGGHAHDLGESLLGMVERAIAIVEDTDSVPEFWLLPEGVVSNGDLGDTKRATNLGIAQVVQCLLV